MLAAEVPKITDWMQAWGSLIGVAVSGLAVVVTGLLLRHEIRARRLEQAKWAEEQRERQSEQDDRRAAQARLIVPSIVAYECHSQEYPYAVSHIKWQVQNFSGLPMLGLRVIFLGEKPAEEAFMEVSSGTESGLIALHQLIHRGKEDRLPEFAIEISYTDSNGLIWSRRGTQPPKRMVEEGAIVGRNNTISYTHSQRLRGMVYILLTLALVVMILMMIFDYFYLA